MQKFYIGLDVGTQSVGIACTDEDYNLLRAKGKDLWAVRIFDEAQTAADRRVKRAARRRLARRKQRIDFLQEIFAPYIEDNLFFIRLNNSGFFEDDKKDANGEKLNTPFSLFADDDYTDRDYHKEFPTIYHLRKQLIEGGKKHDLRLYYLALHHIIKYRGHFLFDVEGESGMEGIAELFGKLNAISQEEAFADGAIILPVEAAEKFAEIAADKHIKLNDKKREAAMLFGFKSKREQEVVTLLLGGKAKTGVIFGEDYEEKYADEKISFKEITDEEFEAKSAVFEDGQFAFLQAAKAVYNFILLKSVLGGEKYVSDSMVKLYEKHRADLAILKKLIKENCPKEYFKVFRSTSEKANYANYIGYSKSHKAKINAQKCKADDFYKFIKGIVAGKCTGQTADYVLSEIENGNFLPKILNADNGIFPHQINGAELDAILRNLCFEYPCFAVKQDDGYTPAKKIKKLFLFKIPYSVGPLNNRHEYLGNSWVVKKEGRVTPFNYDETVDEQASNEKFIRRMTNKCTYLHGKDVLPKHSIIYQKFNVLNQLNKWKFNEQPLSVELKKAIFNELFLTHKKVTKRGVRDWLVVNGYLFNAEAKDFSLTGIDGEINASMSSYVLLKGILGEYVDSRLQVCEDIILWHTLNTDKNVVERCLKDKYGDDKFLMSKIKELKRISSFKEFGRLSGELLCEVSGGVDPVTGENYTILGELYNTNKNFNEIIYDKKYTFEEALAELNGDDGKVDYRAVEELNLSPMVRRGVWQSIEMVDEYVRAVGSQPDKIFIEVTRTEGKKQRTVSRKNKLLELYNGLGRDCREYGEIIAKLNSTTESALRQERLYLYFAQLGRCAYTGKIIDLGNLNSDIYDVDHIMPRSIIKDDSLDNKVLVLREKNAQKSDTYPLEIGFTDQQRFWSLLHVKGLMSDKKLNLLKRATPLNEDDLHDFINRQLVVTNQSVKAVAELLGRKYKNTKIVYSKAKNVADFKQKFSIVKCRETNDLHHARDAYLNIAVGNVYDVKFSCASDYYYRKDDFWREYNLDKLFFKNTVGAWDKDRSLKTVAATLAKPSMRVTAYSFIKQGRFYDETILSGKSKEIRAPRKECAPYTNVAKYGGYSSLKIAHFSIVRSFDKKGNRIVTIEAVPVLEYYKMGKSAGETEEKLKSYFIKMGLVEPEILIAKLKIKSLVSVNGFMARIAGATGQQIILHNAVQWFTDAKTDLYVKNLVKLVDMEREGKLSEEEKNKSCFIMSTNSEGEVKLCIDEESNLKLYDEIIAKLATKCYGGVSYVENFSDNIKKGRDNFIGLTCLNQAKVLLQVVRFMKCNAETSDLKLIGEGSNLGKIRINKNITGVDFAIIHQSACGLTERKVKIF